MYCSIQEAWGNKEPELSSDINNNYQENKVNINTSLTNLKQPEHFNFNEINEINQKPLTSIVENFTDKDIEEFLVWKNNETNNISKECLNIIDHFKNCEKCKNYYYKINGNSLDLNSLISKLGVSLIDTSNREMVVIFLIGIVLILIFHLFNK